MNKIYFILCLLFLISCRDNEPKPNNGSNYKNDSNNSENIYFIGDTYYIL